MKSLIKSSFYILCICFTASCNKTNIAPFWEIPDPHLDEIAMVRADPNWGTAVIYNPDTCSKIGNACGFFKLHAYSHDILRHGILAEPDDYPALNESAADCYAAKYGKPQDVYAAVKLLEDETRDSALRIHGDPAERAARIRRCAEEIGNWSTSS